MLCGIQIITSNVTVYGTVTMAVPHRLQTSSPKRSWKFYHKSCATSLKHLKFVLRLHQCFVLLSRDGWQPYILQRSCVTEECILFMNISYSIETARTGTSWHLNVAAKAGWVSRACHYMSSMQARQWAKLEHIISQRKYWYINTNMCLLLILTAFTNLVTVFTLNTIHMNKMVGICSYRSLQ